METTNRIVIPFQSAWVSPLLNRATAFNNNKLNHVTRRCRKIPNRIISAPRWGCRSILRMKLRLRKEYLDTRMLHTIKEIESDVNDDEVLPGKNLKATPTVPNNFPTPKRKGLLRIHAQRPIWTYVLVVTNVAVWLVQRLTLCLHHVSPQHGSLVPNLQTLGAKISSNIMKGQVWRLLTPAFLHVNARHLFFNTYALFALGSAVEILYGSAAFIAIYIVGAIGGNIASLLANVSSHRPSVGSSGAVFALIAAMCVHLYRNRGPIGPVAQEKLRLVTSATMFNLAGGWLMPSVDGWAHFGGVFYGMIFGAMLAPQVILHRSEDTGLVTFVEVRRRGKLSAFVAIVSAIMVSVLVVCGVGMTVLV